MERADALNAFIAVVNAIEPDHPYYDSPYPVAEEDVHFGWTRTHYARCGPAKEAYKIHYDTRMTCITTLSREQHLSLITHEIAHISAPSFHGSSGHPPEFWYQMSLHALEVKEELEHGDLRVVFPEVDIEQYLHAVWTDPNSATVDRRYWSVSECAETIQLFLNGQTDAFTEYLPKASDYELLSAADKRVTINITESSESHALLVDLPGIGERTVLHIGSTYDHAEEMVDGCELDEAIREIVSPYYDDELWYALRVNVDRRYLSENDRMGLFIPSIARSLYFKEDGTRRLPTGAEIRRHVQQRGH